MKQTTLQDKPDLLSRIITPFVKRKAEKTLTKALKEENEQENTDLPLTLKETTQQQKKKDRLDKKIEDTLLTVTLILDIKDDNGKELTKETIQQNTRQENIMILHHAIKEMEKIA